ncbi:MAG: thiamine diphosphokinase [SAR324 cluster bacterium]|nr:thiamine diphosphokinase [SAR324 cluster bacterium]
MKKTALIVCNGKSPDPAILARLWEWADLKIAADGGANQLLQQNRVPDVIIGDGDSLKASTDTVSAIPLIKVDEQNTNDADKAIRYCLQHQVTEIHLLGADGKRMDHFLANLEVLYKYSDEARIILWTATERIECIRTQWNRSLESGTVLSLLPLFGGGFGIETHGLKYELRGTDLVPGKEPTGLSNEVLESDVHISLKQGCLFLIYAHQSNLF